MQGPWRAGAALALLCLLVAGGAAAEQPFVGIAGVRGSIGVNGQGDFESVDTPGQGTQRLENLLFDQRLGLGVRGAIYDKNVAAFDVGGDVGFVQERTSVDSDTRTGDGYLLGYNTRLTLLRDQPYSLDVFAVRDTNNMSRDFAGTARTTTELFAATAYLRNLPLPLVLDLRQEEVDQRFTLSPYVARLNERRRLARLTGARSWETHDLTLGYEYARREDLVNAAGTFDLQEGDVLHQLFFGGGLEHQLFSSARYLETKGQFDVRSILATETLRLDYDRGLSNYFSFLFADNQLQGGSTTTYAGSAILTHQLYQSLTTNLGAGGSTSSLPDGSISSVGPFLDVAYQKRIPWDGTISLGTGASYRLQDQDVPGGVASVFQEQHTFADTAPFTLNNPNVILSTIVITNQSSSIVYDEGADYSVQPLGNLVQIVRNPLGRILPGETVLVSYDYEVSPDLRYYTIATHYGVSLDFPWVGVFYSLSDQDSTLLEGENVSGDIEDIRDQRVGFELRVPSGGPFTAAARQEYEDYHSQTLAYTAYLLTQNLSYMISEALTLSATGGEAFYDYSTPSRTTDIYLARGVVNWRPLSWALVEGFVGMRAWNDSQGGDTRFLEGGVRGRVRIGQIDFNLGYTHAVRRIDQTDSVGDGFQFSLTRWFGR